MTQEHLELSDRCVAHNYRPLPVVIASARGAWVTDVEGRRYLDMLSAYSALNFGHNHPALVQALKDQLDRCALTSRAFHNDQLAPFCEELASLCGQEMVLPMNTGAEAVETAIKTARRWGCDRKGVAADRARIMVFHENFHGRTTTIVGFSSDEQSRRGFGPFAPGFDAVPYGDLDAARRAVTRDTVAILVEPIQGEAGVIVPPPGFLAGLRAICSEHNLLLMADEIQTGLGRTGRIFACDHESVLPDVHILGKALGGGLLPVSAVVSRRDVLDVFKPGDHGSTFGGNPLGAAVGRKAIELIRDGDFVERAAREGEHLSTRLKSLNHARIRDIRGRGLLVGIELHRSSGKARPVVEELMRRGLLCKDTHEQTIRLAPPLTIERKDLDWAVDEFAAALDAA